MQVIANRAGTRERAPAANAHQGADPARSSPGRHIGHKLAAARRLAHQRPAALGQCLPHEARSSRAGHLPPAKAVAAATVAPAPPASAMAKVTKRTSMAADSSLSRSTPRSTSRQAPSSTSAPTGSVFVSRPASVSAQVSSTASLLFSSPAPSALAPISSPPPSSPSPSASAAAQATLAANDDPAANIKGPAIAAAAVVLSIFVIICAIARRMGRARR